MRQQTIDRLTELVSKPSTDVRPPEGAEVLWAAFQRLSRARTSGAAGPNPITFSDIHAWMRITRTPLSPAHVQIIERMDQAYLERAYERSNVPAGTPVSPRVSSEALTPALFDVAID